MNSDQIAAIFPPDIQVPNELVQLCDWQRQNGYPISGGFELRIESIKHWFGTDHVSDRFGVFGTGPDGSLYSFWIQDDRRIAIVHMGSEGQNNFVLAENFNDFLRLLAIGYGELGFDDLSLQPDLSEINPKFQNWVCNTFKVTIPKTGIEIVSQAQNKCQDFQEWINKILHLQ